MDFDAELDEYDGEDYDDGVVADNGMRLH